MKITLLRDERDNTGEVYDLTWDQIVGLLGKFRTGEKSGLSWCACAFAGTRSKKNVIAVELAVFDLDGATSLDDLNAMRARLAARGWEHVIHSTASFTPSNPRTRVVFQLDHAVLPQDWPAFRAVVSELFGVIDKEDAKDASRLFYLPTVPKDGGAPFFEHVKGVPVPVDSILSVAKENARNKKATGEVPLAFSTSAVKVETHTNAEGQIDLVTLIEGCKPDIKRLLTQKEPWASVGGRDFAIFGIAKYLGTRYPDVPADALLALMRPGLEKLDPPEVGTWFEIAFAKLKQGQEWGHQSRAEKAAVIDDMRASLARDSARTAAPKAQETGATSNASPEPTQDAPGGTEYEPHEIASWALDQGCASVADFARRWVIQKDSAFYVFVEGRYLKPVSAAAIEGSLHRDLARVPGLKLFKEANGNTVPASADEIFRQCRTVARSIEGSLTLQKSYYDSRTQTFHEAVTPLRVTEPKEFPEIQRWLEVMGGPHAEKLLNWVAAVPRLDHQSCALYLAGASGAGKSLLAGGLSRLWSVGGPSKLSHVLTGFNEALARCPLLVADEKLPDEKGMTALLREMIGESSRQLNRKFMSTATVTGAVRLLICGNNDQLLDTNEDLSAADREAVSQRFLFIAPGEDSTEYLESLGQPVCDAWIVQDKIAQHALYLSATRKLEEKSRFLVSGDLTEFHDHLAVNSGLANLVSQWLVTYLSDQATEGQRNPEIEIGRGFYFVTTKALASESQWVNRCPGTRVPSMSKLGNTLRGLSRDFPAPTMTFEGRVFFNVDPNLILTWAKRAGVGNMEFMKARLNRG